MSTSDPDTCSREIFPLVYGGGPGDFYTHEMEIEETSGHMILFGASSNHTSGNTKLESVAMRIDRTGIPQWNVITYNSDSALHSHAYSGKIVGSNVYMGSTV